MATSVAPETTTTETPATETPASETPTTPVTTATPSTPAATETPQAPPTEATPAEETPKDGERPRGPDGKFVTTYKLELPQDAALPVASIERTVAMARELGLSNDAAQQVLMAANAEAKALLDAQQAAWEPGKGDLWMQRNSEWSAAALKDPDIGGTPEKLAKSVELGQSVLKRFFPADVMDVLTATGWGSNPSLIKGLAAIGRGMSEGTLQMGGQITTPPQRKWGELTYENNGEGPKRAIQT